MFSFQGFVHLNVCIVSCELETLIPDTCTSSIGLQSMKAVGRCNGLSIKTRNKRAAFP